MNKKMYDLIMLTEKNMYDVTIYHDSLGHDYDHDHDFDFMVVP